MAITDAQKVDYLYKKIGFGVAKTDTSAFKSPSNEANASPLLTRGDTVWVNSGSIPGTIPASNSNVVVLYKDSLTTTVECTLDTSASGTNRTWLTNLRDWIPPEFGSSYQVKVYAANPGVTNAQTAGTQLFADGSGNNDSWFFDYQSGILNFADTNVPTAVTSKKIYISGARYAGPKGVASFETLTIGNITINGDSITGTNAITFGSNTSTGNAYITTAYIDNFYYSNGHPIIFSSYSNANVASYLPIYSGNISANTVTANIQTNYINSSTGSIILKPAGNLVIVNTTGAIVVGSGNTAARPSDAITGAFRFNTDTNLPEYYGGSTWIPIGPSMITSQSITPDGSSVEYTLDHEATSNGIIVSINGTLQQPGSAYNVAGNKITFAEVPLTTDIVEVRFISAAVVLEENSGVVSAANINLSTSTITVDSFDTATYRSARYTISATAINGDTQISEIYLVHNGIAVATTVGSNTYVGANVATYSANIAGSYVNFQATAVNLGSIIRIQKLYFAV